MTIDSWNDEPKMVENSSEPNKINVEGYYVDEIQYHYNTWKHVLDSKCNDPTIRKKMQKENERVIYNGRIGRRGRSL